MEDALARLVHAVHRDIFNQRLSEKNAVVDLMATTIKTIGGIEDRLFILGKQACDVDLKSPVLIVENKNSKQNKYGRCK